MDLIAKTPKGSLSLSGILEHELFPKRQSDYIRWYPKELKRPNERFQDGLEGANPRGFYIHVPFCDQICRFCPFNKRQTDAALVNGYVAAAISEIRTYAGLVDSSAIEFVYFGGGTPSVLSEYQISKILEEIHLGFGVESTLEVTLESHPTHLSRDFVKGMRKSGVTRFSTGIQSFDDQVLRTLGAQHTRGDALTAIDAVTAGGNSVAIDLLYRSPGQTVDDWKQQLSLAKGHGGIDHISCYSLVLKSDRDQPSLSEDAEMGWLATEILESDGYRHYASCATGGYDLARPGLECAYEFMHWAAPQAEFVGIGPGAFGFLGGTTTVNGLDIQRYIETSRNGSLYLASANQVEEEELMHRYFVLGMKTLGVDLGVFEREFGSSADDIFGQQMERLTNLGITHRHDDKLILTAVGRHFVDEVSAMFFSMNQRFIPHPEEPEIRAIELLNAR